jgi:hypothetical protein
MKYGWDPYDLQTGRIANEKIDSNFTHMIIETNDSQKPFALVNFYTGRWVAGPYTRHELSEYMTTRNYKPIERPSKEVA